MGGTGDLTEIERQLLMAAEVHGLGPGTDLGRANTARVVHQVLRWRGHTADEVRDLWLQDKSDREHDEVYNALIRMTHVVHREVPGRPPERSGVALFEGGAIGAFLATRTGRPVGLSSIHAG